MSLLTLTTSHEQEAVRVSLSGELDLSSALTFDEELRRIEDETDVSDLILDLGELKFMDSTGLRLTGMLERLDVVDDRTAPA